MWKVQEQGGIKLINLDVKSQAAQAKWLVRLVTNENLHLNYKIFSHLLGTQPGQIKGRDIIFLKESYFKYTLKTQNKFYKSALLALSQLEIKKGIKNVTEWAHEHIFYNPILLTEDEKTLTLTGYCKKLKIFKYEQLLQEKYKEQQKLNHDKALLRLLDKIKINTSTRQDDVLVTGKGEEMPFYQVTQQILYVQILHKMHRDHSSQIKWAQKLYLPLNWYDIWNTVHNVLSNNSTKTVIWQQLHLNFYTQFSYNKWKNKSSPCSLCSVVPNDIYHLILHCPFSNQLWSDIEPILRRIHPININIEEQAFGIIQKKPKVGVLLRNWLTYLLREFISKLERAAYYSKNTTKLQLVKCKFNAEIHFEIDKKIMRYKSDNSLTTFDKFFTFNNILCAKREDGSYEIKKVFS